MQSNRLAFAALALACVVAAGAGGYLANRSVEPTQATAVQAVAEAPQAPAGSAVTTPAAEHEAPAASAAAAAASSVAPSPALPPSLGGSSVVGSPAPRPVGAKTQVAQRPSATRDVKRDEGPTSRPSAGSAPSAESAQDAPAPPTPDVATPAPSSEERAAENRGLETRGAEKGTSDIRITEVRSTSSDPNPGEVVQSNLEELTVAADSVIGLKLERAISSERARVEDEVDAQVVRDVRVGQAVAIPAGSRAIGSVTLVERGGRLKERARLAIRFHTLVLNDGTRLPITTEAIFRYGDSPGDSSAKKIGTGAVAGAILGAIIGGGKGAAIGAAAGAGGGTAMVMASDRSAAEFVAGTEVTARILAPVTVTLER